jgi:hypothetical protein
MRLVSCAMFEQATGYGPSVIGATIDSWLKATPAGKEQGSEGQERSAYHRCELR